MDTVLDKIDEFIFRGDVQEKTLIQYPSITYAVVVLYVVFVKWLGPALMRGREPLSLKWLMIVYDMGQVFVNGCLTYNIYTFSWETWEGRCLVKYNPLFPFYVDRLLRVGWFVYLVKLADLLDTCFFVLRKKHEQISFLHVFHHALMCVMCAWAIKNLPSYAMGYYIGFAFSINTSVHCVVYFYYMVAAFGPHMNKYLWWKKYLTQFQMVQFTLILGYMFYGFATGCEEMGVVEISTCIYIIVIYALFIDFYKKYKEE